MSMMTMIKCGQSKDIHGLRVSSGLQVGFQVTFQISKPCTQWQNSPSQCIKISHAVCFPLASQVCSTFKQEEQTPVQQIYLLSPSSLSWSASEQLQVQLHAPLQYTRAFQSIANSDRTLLSRVSLCLELWTPLTMQMLIFRH